MFAVPAETPDTLPETSTDAMPGAGLLQVPPGDGAVSVVIWPIHTTGTPVILPSAGFTVTVTVARQLVGNS